MPTAESVYVDPSALARLFIHQAGSREMVAWRSRVRGGFPVTPHGRLEIINAIAQRRFRGEFDLDKATAAWQALELDFAEGRLQLVNPLWRAAIQRAVELSLSHTAVCGTRAADVLHVACALELGLRHFGTFDERQGRLAREVGLKVVRM